MRKTSRVAALLTAFSICLVSVRAIPKVTRVGRYLYEDGGPRFYIKGIAYQEQGEVDAEAEGNDFQEPSTFIDPLALGDACTRDLPYLQQLGVNTLRVYSVDFSLNHDSCMKTFSDAGIYTIIDLSLPLNGSIDRDVPSWSTNILNGYFRTIDAFSKYDNVLAYNIGNEVVVSDKLAAAPFVKAAARETKGYLKSKSSNVLVGYAAINGGSGFRNAFAEYLSCGEDGTDATAIDIYGLNDYEWCGDSTFADSYAGTTESFADYNVAAYFSEFGCILGGPRLWTETQAIFSSDMSPVWSGGIAFSYFPAASAQGQFGMVTISGNTVTTTADFDRLATEYTAAGTGPNVPTQASASASTYGACPAPVADFSVSNTLPPTPNEEACNCLMDALGCQFTPHTPDYSPILGALVGTTCGLLGQSGGSCDDISGDGLTGVYGLVSGCDPIIKLSYIMSEYYEASNRAAQACSFGGNGTVNPLATSSTSAAAAAKSCNSNPDATFVVTGVPSATSVPGSTTPGGGNAGSGNNGNGNNGGSNNGNTNNDSAALGVVVNIQGMVGLGLVTLLAIVGGASIVL